MGYLSCRADSSISTFRSISALSPTSHHQKSNQASTPPLHKFSYDELSAATSDFSPSSLLGRGSHGSVFKALLPHHSSTPLAVKLPSSPSAELPILSRLRSPRLVNLLGYSEPRPHPLLVFEYMPRGTLFDLLHSGSKNSLSWQQRLRLALQVSKALLVLHEADPVVIHRDVKSANVLIDRDFNARLGDFGLAIQVSDHHDCNKKINSTPPAGTLGYLDPGYVRPENLSTKTDVFSFGILLIEIMSGRKAIDVAYSPPSVVDWAVPLLRSGRVCGVFDPRIGPIKDVRARRELAWLAASCVRSRKEKRPSMREVVERLKVVSKMVSSRGWNGLVVGNPCSVVDTESALLKLNLGNGTLDQSWDDDDDKEEESSGHDEEMGFCEKKPSPVIVRASQPLKSMRKVFDNNASTGRSRNLIDLMNQTDDELIRELSADANAAKGYKISRARTVHVSRNCGDKDAILQLRRNSSMRGVTAVKPFPRLKEVQNIDAKAHVRAGDLT